MDPNATTAEHSIRRIVAVLLALADLAECAGGRSPAVRGLVLWLLRSGEVLARDYLAALTPRMAGQGAAPPFTHDSADASMRLAARFRDIAAALTALVSEILASPQQTIAALRGGTRFDTFAAAGSLAAFRAPTAIGRRDSS